MRGFATAARLFVMLCYIVCSVCTHAVNAGTQQIQRPWVENQESTIPREALLAELARRLVILGDDQEAEALPGKRGADFGLGRGFSATQAAKHKMGLEAAAFPSGPGRRRRALPARPES